MNNNITGTLESDIQIPILEYGSNKSKQAESEGIFFIPRWNPIICANEDFVWGFLIAETIPKVHIYIENKFEDFTGIFEKSSEKLFPGPEEFEDIYLKATEESLSDIWNHEVNDHWDEFLSNV
ncbi:hypothetical protein ES705_51152 [subsurface metagenome]